MCIGIHLKYLLFLSDIYETRNFLDRLSKNVEMSHFMNIRPFSRKMHYVLKSYTSILSPTVF